MKIITCVFSGIFILATSVVTHADIAIGGFVEEMVSIEPEILVVEDLDLTENSAVVIATTTENSNVSSGYNVTITTTNDFRLVSPTTKDTPIDYHLLFAGGDVQNALKQGFPAYRSAAITDGKTHQNIMHYLTMTYQGRPATEIVAGDYTDTIEIKIQAN